mmetsp:Transcript_9630/g.39619  ORF Transcript_9630/g.39619 Transcript_9630/m.39619 type:complete len:230 (+) Transcript_9630:1178-1867(+)
MSKAFRFALVVWERGRSRSSALAELGCGPRGVREGARHPRPQIFLPSEARHKFIAHQVICPCARFDGRHPCLLVARACGQREVLRGAIEGTALNRRGDRAQGARAASKRARHGRRVASLGDGKRHLRNVGMKGIETLVPAAVQQLSRTVALVIHNGALGEPCSCRQLVELRHRAAQCGRREVYPAVVCSHNVRVCIRRAHRATRHPANAISAAAVAARHPMPTRGRAAR